MKTKDIFKHEYVDAANRDLFLCLLETVVAPRMNVLVIIFLADIVMLDA